jgi:hypothetical protein
VVLVLIRVESVGTFQELSDLNASHATADIVALKHDTKVDQRTTKAFSVV